MNDKTADDNNIRVHQIFYSKETRDSLDPGFIPLDNLANERPDWREYWPMRNFLLENELSHNSFYGFFSPKFNEKTGLQSAQVNEFVRANTDADVILFSPFFDHGAFFLNLFQHGNHNHKGIGIAFEKSVGLVYPDVDYEKILMHSGNIVFCNYFLAKPAFWARWLELNEELFAEAERGESEVAIELNGGTNHDNWDSVPKKVFMQERMTSLILAVERHWKVAAYNSIKLPFGDNPWSKFPKELIVMDSLKKAYDKEGFPEYLHGFFHYRKELIDRIKR